MSYRLAIFVSLLSVSGAAPTGRAASRPTAAARIADAVELLTGANEPAGRAIGARNLLALDSQASRRELLNVLRDSTRPAAQLAVCEALAASPTQRADFVDPLVELLGDPAAPITQAAAEALRHHASPELKRRLLQTGTDQSLPAARRIGALLALGEMGEERHSVEILIDLLRGKDDISDAALLALRYLTGEEFPDTKTARRWWTQYSSLDTTAWLQRRNEIMRGRVRYLESSRDRLTARLLTVLRADYQSAPEAERPARLIAMLGDALPEVRLQGVQLVDALITDRKPVPADVGTRLASLLDDSAIAVRCGAVSVLGDLRDTRCLNRILVMLKKEPDPATRAAAATAAGKVGGTETAAALVTALDDPAPVVVGAAATALGAIGAPAADAQVTNAILARYRRVKANEQRLAEAFLGAMERLAAPAFRTASLTALHSPAIGVRRQAIACAAATDDGTTAQLVRPMLSERDASIRLAAADALARCGRDESDLAALAAHLDLRDEPDESVRRKAWEALLKTLHRQPEKVQLAWAERFDRAGDRVAANQRIEILIQIEKLLADRSPASLERRDVLLKLGDAEMALGRTTDAAAHYEQALRIPGASSDDTALGLRIFDSALRARNARAAFTLIGHGRPTASRPAQAMNASVVGRRVAAVLTDFLEDRDAIAAEDLDVQTTAWLAQQTSLDPPVRTELEHLHQQVAELRQTLRIDDLLEQAKSDGPNAVAACAELKKIGAAALPALVETLTECVEKSDAVDPAELRLIDVARTLRPAWAGYDARADREEQFRALDQLRGALPPTTSQAVP